MSDANLQTRPYRAADFASCCRLFESNVPRYFASGELAAYQQYLIDHASSGYWVVEQGAELVAGGGAWVRSDEASLCYGMVLASRHRHGLGSRLMRFRLAQMARNAAIQRIVLHTSQHTAGFFLLFGFLVTGEAVDGWAPGLHRIDMVLDLNAQADRRARLMEELGDQPGA